MSLCVFASARPSQKLKEMKDFVFLYSYYTNRIATVFFVRFFPVFDDLITQNLPENTILSNFAIRMAAYISYGGV